MATAAAAELSYGVDAGVGFADNITRVSEDEQSDTIASIGAELSLDHKSSRIDAKVASRLEFRDYLDDTFESEVVGNLIGESIFDLIENRLTWALDDTFGQSAINQLAAVTPANRENVNFLSTGPDFSLPLGSRNMLILGGRYEDVSYEDSALGNNRITGKLTVQRELSAGSHVSLNANTEQVSYDDTAQFDDFDRNEAVLGYEVNAARTQMTLEAGMTEIRLNDDSDDGWLGRFKFTRQASTSLSVGLELGHEFSDAGNAFVQQQALQPGSTDSVWTQQSASPFTNDYGEVFADFRRNRTGLGARLGYYDETYVGDPLSDRKRLSLELNLQRSLSAVLTADITAEYSQEDYTEISRKFSELDATIGLHWQVGRATSLGFEYAYYDRNDDVGTSEYRANEIWVRLGYLVGEGVGSGVSSGM